MIQVTDMGTGVVGGTPGDGKRIDGRLEGSTTAHVLKTGVSTGRNTALDFTKGLLVLLMVLYHWINYFVSRDGDFYKYLRFITPSFIFITGFLIANVYLAKYRVGDPRLHLRLLQRGLKLLGLFTLLNVAGAFVFGRPAPGIPAVLDFFLDKGVSIYVTGNGKPAAFSVLVPIGQLLILSSILLQPMKRWKYFVPGLCLLLFGLIYQLDVSGVSAANLELFAAGLFGMVFGQVPFHRINLLARYPLLIAVAYAVYLMALNIWGEIYPLQLTAVVLSLLVMYLVGLKAGAEGWVQKLIILLGNYSLLAYIVQIAVVVLLSAGFRLVSFGRPGILFLSFLGAFLLTLLAVAAVDAACTRSKLVRGLYRFVFA